MRDDTHKTAPVSAVWKTAIRDCGQEAEFNQAHADWAVERAVRSELARLGGDLVEIVARALSEPRLPFGGPDPARRVELTRPLEPIEARMIEWARIHAAHADACRRARDHALRHTTQALVSNIASHVARVDP